MSASVQLGLAFAVATAFASIVGFLYKQRGAVESPAVEWRRPLATSLALFRSRWYVLGIVIATASWGLHVTALSLAPITLVQSVIAGGLVLLTVIADRLFGMRVTRREWIGVGACAVGLTFLAATLDGAAGSAHSDYAVPTLALYVLAGLGIGAAAGAYGWRPGAGGIGLAASAGLIWGASDVAIKAQSDDLDRGLLVLAHPLTLVIIVLSAAGLVVSSRSLQIGRAVPVIAVTSAAANLTTIASGPIVFGEPLPDDALGLTVRLLAFALVIVAAALIPAPVGVTAPASAAR